MASVFKRGRDKGKRGAAWHFEFIDEKGKPRMRKGFTDKGLTQQLANKVEAEAKLRRDGAPGRQGYQQPNLQPLFASD